MSHLLFVDFSILELGGLYTRHHAQKLLHTAHILDLTELVQIIVQSEGRFQKLLFKLCRFLFVKLLFRFFDKGEHVAHTEDTGSHSVRMEGLYIFYLFAHADKLYGLAGYVSYGKRRTAAGVAVQLGENNAGYIKQVIKAFRYVYRILTCHGVYYQKGFGGVDFVTYTL